MLSAIYFNNDTILKANKINNVIVYRLLSSEFPTFHLFHS